MIPGGQLPNEGNAWQVRARLWLCIRLCLPLKPQSPGEFPGKEASQDAGRELFTL